VEPLERALDWYAKDLCQCCGYCVITGQRSKQCPGILEPEQVLFSPQGFGPARNIIGYTGGDLGCCIDFYLSLTREIKIRTSNLLVLYETNGYGLTTDNLIKLKDSGVDSFWLDIKAYHPEVHQKLCGVSNERILQLPAQMVDFGFQLEVLSLYIPGWVETDQLSQIAGLISKTDPDIPFTLLAFFPEYMMYEVRPPHLDEMIEAYRAVKNAGLQKVRIGNIGVFARSQQDIERLNRETDRKY
jgi:pyruvate-formate lyase-activating enzyme